MNGWRVVAMTKSGARILRVRAKDKRPMLRNKNGRVSPAIQPSNLEQEAISLPSP